MLARIIMRIIAGVCGNKKMLVKNKAKKINLNQVCWERLSMKLIKRAMKIIFGILIISLLLILFLPSRTPRIEGSNSIAAIQKIELGGINQFIMLRGKNVNNPILLFLHGGPGYSQISFARKYQKEQEESFIVVNWDQRGSGMSYSNNIPNESMNREQFIEDTNELIEYLCKRYNKEKVYLVGHSWGSELGMYVVDRYPERIAAFISVGQLVHGAKNESLSYDYTLERAKKENNEKALADLLRIGKPPYKNFLSDMMVQRKWLKEYGGAEKKVNTLKDIVVASIFSLEYKGIDGIKLAIGSKFSADTMFSSTLEKVDIMSDIPKVKVPVYFCVGKYDYNTPSELTKEYYEQLVAPEKELIWFEESAHFPHFEEPKKFNEIVLGIKEKLEK
jgi:pimeloyl-ACP methyl ester carboxylesterase